MSERDLMTTREAVRILEPVVDRLEMLVLRLSAHDPDPVIQRLRTEMLQDRHERGVE